MALKPSSGVKLKVGGCGGLIVSQQFGVGQAAVIIQAHGGYPQPMPRLHLERSPWMRWPIPSILLTSRDSNESSRRKPFIRNGAQAARVPSAANDSGPSAAAQKSPRKEAWKNKILSEASSSSCVAWPRWCHPIHQSPGNLQHALSLLQNSLHNQGSTVESSLGILNGDDSHGPPILD